VNLLETIRETIVRHDLIPADEKIVAGISGGADSVALLRLLHALDIPCTVVHLNHCLRGEESDADEQFVESLARELGFPFYAKSVDVRAQATASGQSIEMAAREARHTFFAEFGHSTIALGHHADDQVETFILKLARGAGTAGLSGMPYAQEIGPIRLVRPLLDVRRSAIVAWLESNRYPWREDTSNTDERMLRNRVRHNILPVLEQSLNPNIREAVLRTMDILQNENSWMDTLLANQSWQQDLPLAAKRRLMRTWLFEQGAQEAGFETVEHILAQMEAGEGSKIIELNARQRVVVEYGKPRFEERSGSPDEPKFHLTVESGTGWRTDHGRGAGILPAEASVDAAMVGDSPLSVRAWQPGDRIAPRGMDGSRKLQDILTDQKIPQADRTGVPVVVCREEVIWVPGYRIARGWAVDGADGKSLHLRVEQN